MANYKECNRDQIEMKLISINDFVELDHPARVIVNIIDKLDLTEFDACYQNDHHGNSAYPIRNTLCTLIYAYLNGVYYMRKIERNCYENIVYRYLCCDMPPDHSTLSRFWKRFKPTIENLLTQTVHIGISLGLIDLEHISGDGVKLKSIGSPSMLLSKENSEKKLLHIQKVIKTLTKKIEESEESEEKKEMQTKLEKAIEWENRINEGIEELKKRHEESKKALERGERKEQINYYHLTEDDPKLMKRKDGFISGYNAQAISDSRCQMILTGDTSTNCNDIFLGKPLLEKASEVLGKENLKKGCKTFDNGYLQDIAMLKYCKENELDIYVAIGSSKSMYGKEQNKKNKQLKSTELIYDEKQDVYICRNGEILEKVREEKNDGKFYAVYRKLGCKQCIYVEDCITTKNKNEKRKQHRIDNKNDEIKVKEKNELIKAMEEKMLTEEAKEIYKKRFYNIEPVFAHIEEHRNFRRFTVWGLVNVKLQWLFICFVHNINKFLNYSDFGRNIQFEKVV
jgi:transposase